MGIKYKKLKIKRPNDAKIKFDLSLKGKSEVVIKKARRDKFLNTFFSVSGVFVLFFTFGTAVFFITLINFKPVFLLWLCKIILGIIAFIVSCIFAAFIFNFSPGFVRLECDKKFIKDAKKEYCKKYRDFYLLKKDYVLTACYKHFDDNFSNRPVCLFLNENKLCITGDIVNGFLNVSCDIGMYEIDFNSIENIECMEFEGKKAYKVVAESKEMVFAWRAKYILSCCLKR